jgi:hypothetical protein
MPRFFIGLIVFIAVGIFVLAGAFLATKPTGDQQRSVHDTSEQQQRQPTR